ncbi:MAG: helix-turn-helix domain-containing protein [Pseudonocardiaceae bacterium]
MSDTLIVSGGLRGPERERVAAVLAQRFVRGRVPIRELAAEVGRRPSLVRRLLTEASVHTEDTSRVGGAETEIVAALVARYREGIPVERLSRETGIDRRVVRRLVAEAGVRMPIRHPLPVDRIGWVVEQYRTGASLRGLAEVTGSSYSTIRRVLLGAGVTLRSPGVRAIRTGETR